MSSAKSSASGSASVASAAAALPPHASSFESQFLATLQHARRKLEDRVKFARARLVEIDAAQSRLTARFQQQERKLAQRERDELTRLLSDYDSGAAQARLEEDLQPFRQAYVEITRESDQRLVSATVQELKLCADPETMQAALSDRRSRRVRVQTVDAALRRNRIGPSTAPSAARRQSAAAAASGAAPGSSSSAPEPLFREYMGSKTTGKRALHDVLHSVSAIIDATPSLPPVIEQLSAELGPPPPEDAARSHMLFLQRAPSGYMPPSSADAAALASQSEVTKRARIKDRAASLIEAAYNIENLNVEMARMRGELENAVLVVNKDVCESCHRPMVIIAEACLSVCPQCKRARTYIQTSAVVRNTTNRGPDGGRLKRHSKSGVFDEFFNRWMGLGKKVEDGVVAAVRHALFVLGVRAREQVSMCLVHFLLESLNAEKIMQMKVQIYCRLTGSFPPRMTKEQQSLVNSMRRAVLVPWDSMMQRSGRRRVTSLCEFVLFKIVQLLGWSHLSEFFTLLTCSSSERYLMVCDEIWRGVCAAYDWEYIPTVLSVPMCAESLGVRLEDVSRVLLETYGGAPQPPTYALSKLITSSCSLRRASNAAAAARGRAASASASAAAAAASDKSASADKGASAAAVSRALASWGSFDDAPRGTAAAAAAVAEPAASDLSPLDVAELAALTPPQRAGLAGFVRSLQSALQNQQQQQQTAVGLEARAGVAPLPANLANVYIFSDTIDVVRRALRAPPRCVAAAAEPVSEDR